MRIRVLLLLIPMTVMAHTAHAQSDCGVPLSLGDGWAAGTPESVGLSSAALCPVVTWLENWKEGDIHAILVVRHDKLVFEHYFTGTDDRMGHTTGSIKFAPDVKHDERSVSKSITSLLVGIAIDRGWIKSVNEKVMPFFPQYADLRTREKDRIALWDLLTMSSGLAWDEFDVPYTSSDNSEIQMNESPDPYRYVLSQPVVAPPGQLWNYSSGSTELLAAILRKATGKPVDQLAKELLFEPLGISDVEWHNMRGGIPMAAAGLRLRPRDLAKIGQLVLQRGTWNGRQIVSARWIQDATSPQINGFMIYFYGYQFWLGRSLAQKHGVDWAAAWGLGGQRVFIVPDLDLVVVVNAGLYNSDMQVGVPIKILDQYVLRAMWRDGVAGVVEK